ncbi:dihydroorotase [Patescibacteria group bacterium]|nr:dihydroorotase [Patescibacteria group bacterium]
MIQIRKPDDFHVHWREGEMLKRVVRYTSSQFARALVMPNLKKPVATAEDVLRYRAEIDRSLSCRCEPLMTIKLLDTTTPEEIREAQRAGVVAAKLYPRGVTTNSENGVGDLESLRLREVLREMQQCDMVLSVHGEWPESYCMDSEALFLPWLEYTAYAFPGLRIVLEHVTTESAVRTVMALPNTVAATVTAHHLAMTTDDVVRGKLRPHNYCAPIAKRPGDREALWNAIGHPKFFFGSDSAPHAREAKECAEGCAGCFTAPFAMQLLATMFDERKKLDLLERFTSEFGAVFYGLPLNTDSLRLWRRPMRIQRRYGTVIPFWAGALLQYSLIP